MSSFGLSFVGRFQLDLNQYPLFGGFTGLEGNIGCQIFGGGGGGGRGWSHPSSYTPAGDY